MVRGCRQGDKVLLVKWWRQFAHTWRHFAFTVPLVRFMQGQQRTWYCGAYTLFNTHEIATGPPRWCGVLCCGGVGGVGWGGVMCCGCGVGVGWCVG